MQFGPWAVALIASTLGGVAVCATLIVRRRWIALCLGGAALATVASALACSAVWSTAHRPDQLIAAVAISIAAGTGGFALGSTVLTAPRKHASLRAEVTVGPPSPGTHVIVLADAEPEDYDPAAVTEQLHRFEAADIGVPPELAKPLVFASERSRYHRIGGSPARGVVREIAKALHARLVRDGGDFGVAAAFCAGGPTLAEAVAAIAERGGRRIVVAPLAAAWSPAFNEAYADVPLKQLAAAGVTVEAAAPVWASEPLSVMVAQRIVSALGGDRSADGVVLISEGDPWEQAPSQERYREQLTFLIQRVRADLIRAGIAGERIKRAWLWLGEPDMAEAVRHLAAIGARNVVVAPVAYPTETIGTLVDARYAAERASKDTGASVTFIAPWGNDPAVVEALLESIMTAMQRFE